MGTRPCGRVEQRCSTRSRLPTPGFNGDAPVWARRALGLNGHVVARVGFNGDAPVWARREAVGDAHHPAQETLQWGRARVGA